MLERTAGCLETGSLRRLLPASKKSLKNRRALHSAFWNHAAGDVDAQLWAVLVHGADSTSGRGDDVGATLGSSGICLDFLYPTKTFSFMRQYTVGGIERQERQDGRWPAKLGPRLYSTLAADRPVSSSDSHISNDSSSSHATPNEEGLGLLRGEFPMRKSRDFELAWRSFLLLEVADQRKFAKSLIHQFSSSIRPKEAERIISIFETLDHEERDHNLHEIVIRSHLKLHATLEHFDFRNIQEAIQLHRSALKRFHIPTASDLLLAYLLNTSSWSKASTVWLDTQQHFSMRLIDSSYNVTRFAETIPDYAELVCQLVKFTNATMAEKGERYQEIKQIEKARIAWEVENFVKVPLSGQRQNLHDNQALDDRDQANTNDGLGPGGATVDLESVPHRSAQREDYTVPSTEAQTQNATKDEPKSYAEQRVYYQMQDSRNASQSVQDQAEDEELTVTPATMHNLDPDSDRLTFTRKPIRFHTSEDEELRLSMTEVQRYQTEFESQSTTKNLAGQDLGTDKFISLETARSHSTDNLKPSIAVDQYQDQNYEKEGVELFERTNKDQNMEIQESTVAEISQSESEQKQEPLHIPFTTHMATTLIFQKHRYHYSRFNYLIGYLRRAGAINTEEFRGLVSMLSKIGQHDSIIKWYGETRLDPLMNFSRTTLHTVIKSLSHIHDTHGLKILLEDFTRFFKRPTKIAYVECMREFADQGDAKLVHELFDQYIGTYFPQPRGLLPVANLMPLLHVHAKRGEVALVKKHFDEISDKYGLRPSLGCWNILINAYGKLNQYDKAVECFESLLRDTDLEIDDYTVGTLMGMAASRGDIDQVFELGEYAEQLKINKSCAMVDSVVLSYIRNGNLKKAESRCEEAISERLTGTRTRMWNYLLIAYAQARDLLNVNRVLQRMSSLNIKYDEYTYSALMQALCIVGQTGKARQIMKKVLPKAGLKPNSSHYAILMGGYIRNGDEEEVFRLFNEKIIDETASTNMMLLRANMMADEKLLAWGTEEEKFKRAVSMLLEVTFDPQHMATSSLRKGITRGPLDVAYSASLHGYAMFILGQYHEFASVYELYERFKNTLSAEDREHPPINILSALIATKWGERDHKGVEECWNLAMAEAKRQGLPFQVSDSKPDRSESGLNLLYDYELELSRCLGPYLESLADVGKIDLMVQTVNEYMDYGFVLNHQNWNLYIRLLCKRNRVKLAFRLCEARLMPNFPGWRLLRRQQFPNAPHNLPGSFKQMSNNPRYARPLSHTIAILAGSYIRLTNAASESPGYQALLEDLEHLCPKSLNAVISMQRIGIPGQEQAVSYYL
ncbi:hypothetical protein B0J14DRAFT_541444 [Halenospora varia]|nr:hypothetical protein B0J14DRAFT_541444 [Halenospora varia]